MADTFTSTAIDFRVTAHPGARTGPGDGSDEDTDFTFELTPLDAGRMLLSAVLTVELTAAHRGVDSDVIRIGGLGHFRSQLWRGLPPGRRAIVDIQLLEYFAAADLMSVLARGAVSMTWVDDATIHAAELLIRIL